MKVRVPGMLWEMGDYNPDTRCYENIHYQFNPVDVRPDEKPNNVLRSRRTIKTIEVTDPYIVKTLLDEVRKSLDDLVELYRTSDANVDPDETDEINQL